MVYPNPTNFPLSMPNLGTTNVKATYIDLPSDLAQQLPYSVTHVIADRPLKFRLLWNGQANIWLMEMTSLSVGETFRRKLTYGVDVLFGLQHIPEFRGIHITPFDERLRHMNVGLLKDNLGVDVQLYYSVEAL